jgi:hypothetical protein
VAAPVGARWRRAAISLRGRCARIDARNHHEASGDINEYPHHRRWRRPYGIRARGQRRPLGLTMAERTLLIAGTVFGVIVPIGFVLFLLWSMIN